MGHMQGLIQLPRPLGDEPKREAGDGSEDAGAEAKADKQRRKIQNRRNQRAHRQRLKGKDAAGTAGQTQQQQQQRPFKVTRWRLDEVEPVDVVPGSSSQDETSSPASSEGVSTTTHIVSSSQPPPHTRKDWSSSPPTTAHNSAVVVQPLESRLITVDIPSSRHGPQGPSTVTFPLSADHLIHLIQYNVLRALLTNKFVLNIPHGGGDDPESAAAACPISGLYRHNNNNNNNNTEQQPLDPSHIIIPPALAPTPLQKDHHHPIWVNAIPFPRIRDNFIRHTGQFNPWDLLYDLVGEFMTNTPDACVASHPKPTTAAIRAAQRRRRQQQQQQQFKMMLTIGGGGGGGGASSLSGASDDDDDEVTSGRRGLIVWGEPHETQSWEATPGFLAKWAWAVEGCEELVETSNRWRVQRGEEPMRLSVLRRTAIC